MKITIPAKEIITCDCCLKSNKRFRLEGSVVIGKNAMDHMGAIVADGSYRFDLCDECLSRMEAVIQKELASISRSV